MVRVFLSYRKADRALVERIDDALSRHGCATWWDEDIDPRVDWDEEIEREIDAADFVLVLWTKSSVTSSFVKLEAARGMEAEPSKLLQARFDDCRVPMRFSGRQYVDLNPDRPEQSPGWAKLMRWLGLPEPAGGGEPERAGEAPITVAPAPVLAEPPGEGARNILTVMGIVAAVALPLAILLPLFGTSSYLAPLHWLTWILIGLIAGAIAKSITPGRDPGGCLVTIVLGVAGALLAGFLGQQLGWYDRGEGAGFLAAIVGAIVILVVYRLIARR